MPHPQMSSDFHVRARANRNAYHWEVRGRGMLRCTWLSQFAQQRLVLLVRAGYCPTCAPGEIECPLVQNFFLDGMEDRALAASAPAQRGVDALGRSFVDSMTSYEQLHTALGHLRHGASQQAVCRKLARLPVWARGDDVRGPQSLHLQGRGRAGKWVVVEALLSQNVGLLIRSIFVNVPRLHRVRPAVPLTRRRVWSWTTLLTGTSQVGARGLVKAAGNVRRDLWQAPARSAGHRPHRVPAAQTRSAAPEQSFASLRHQAARKATDQRGFNCAFLILFRVCSPHFQISIQSLSSFRGDMLTFEGIVPIRLQKAAVCPCEQWRLCGKKGCPRKCRTVSSGFLLGRKPARSRSTARQAR